jgi:N-acetylmuramoyl-L-alanine amidase
MPPSAPIFRTAAAVRGLGLLILWLMLGLSAAHAARFSRVVIDPGHGGHDNGGQFGYLYEKHLALDVSFRLQRYLEGKSHSQTAPRSPTASPSPFLSAFTSITSATVDPPEPRPFFTIPKDRSWRRRFRG